MRRLIAAGLLAAAVGTAAGFPAPKGPSPFAGPTARLADGMVLDYERTDAGNNVERWYYEFKLTKRDAGGGTFVMKSSNTGRANIDRTLIRTKDTILGVLGDSTRVDVAQFRQGRKPGERFTGTFEIFGVSTTASSRTAEYVAHGEEDVKVPAGRFRARKVTRTHGDESADLWFAPGPGVVKDVGTWNGVAYTLELKAWNPGK